ncbi:MAG: hypothetical protein Q8P13_03655 [bacterium]|nr:hypothetical protein [bacterium]
MKPIKQEDDFGCGVACVASILEIGYQSALSLFREGEKKSQNTGFYCREIVEVLANQGLRYEYNYIKPKLRKRIYKEGEMVFLRRSKKYPEGHYLCRMGKRWMDPWLNFPVDKREAGFRQRLPEKPIYLLYPL